MSISGVDVEPIMGYDTVSERMCVWRGGMISHMDR